MRGDRAKAEERAELVVAGKCGRLQAEDGNAIMAALQQHWQERWERIRRTAAPHRFTYPGQRTPWVDPIPAPDDTSSYKGLPGASPRTMLRTVLLAHAHGGQEAALRWFRRFEPRIASLCRSDWDARLAELRATLGA